MQTGILTNNTCNTQVVTFTAVIAGDADCPAEQITIAINILPDPAGVAQVTVDADGCGAIATACPNTIISYSVDGGAIITGNSYTINAPEGQTITQNVTFYFASGETCNKTSRCIDAYSLTHTHISIMFNRRSWLREEATPLWQLINQAATNNKYSALERVTTDKIHGGLKDTLKENEKRLGTKRAVWHGDLLKSKIKSVRYLQIEKSDYIFAQITVMFKSLQVCTTIIIEQ